MHINYNNLSQYPHYPRYHDYVPDSTPSSGEEEGGAASQPLFVEISQFERDLVALNDQTFALEIGERGVDEGEGKFDRYEKLILNGTKALRKKYREIVNESDPKVRHERLHAILTDLKLINRAREDFMMLIQRDYGVDLDEAKANGRQAMIAIMDEYGQSLEKVEAIIRELSSCVAGSPPSYASNRGCLLNIACFAVRSVVGIVGVVGDFAYGIRHPVKALSIDYDQEVAHSKTNIQDEIRNLVGGVDKDREFLNGLYNKSKTEIAKEGGISKYKGRWFDNDPIKLRQQRYDTERSCRENDIRYNQSLVIAKKDPNTWTEQEKEIMRVVGNEERYKKNIYRVLLGVHALSWGISAYRIRQDGALLAAQAVHMREEVKKAVPLEIAKKIDRETAFLRDQLSRNFENVKNRNFLPVHLKRYPLAIQALEKGLAKYPDNQPTAEEISEICNSFNLNHLIKSSPNPAALPLKSLSVGQMNAVLENELPDRFFEAVIKGNIGEVQQLLKEGANPHWTGAEDGINALHVAGLKGHMEIVRLLLDREVDPYRRCNEGYSSLDLALFNSHHEIAKLLTGSEFNVRQGQDLMKSKMAAHVWEIGERGHFHVGRTIFREGAHPPYFSEQMIQMLTDFHESYPDEMSPEEYAFIREAMIDGIKYRKTYDIANMMQRHHAGLPITIHTGFKGHCIEIVIWNEYLMINNKGGESRKPIELYRMHPAQMTPLSVFALKVAEIIDLKEKSSSHFSTWLESICGNFGAISEEFESIIEKSYPMENKQKVGNCAWESIETSIYALLALHRMVSKGFTKRLAPS